MTLAVVPQGKADGSTGGSRDEPLGAAATTTSHRSSLGHSDQFLCDFRMRVGNAGIVHIVVLELAVLVRPYGPPRSIVVAQHHDLVTNFASPRPHGRSFICDVYLRREGGSKAAFRYRCYSLWLRPQKPFLLDDLYDATAARLYNDGPIVDDRIPVAWPHIVLAGYRVECNASPWQHRADAHIALVPE